MPIPGRLLLINNDDFMEKYKNLIYPPELVLTSDDTKPLSVSYLGLSLYVKENIIHLRSTINEIFSI